MRLFLVSILFAVCACDDGGGPMLRDPVLGAGGGSSTADAGETDGGNPMFDMGFRDSGLPPAGPSYAQLCAPCHGSTGEGGTGPALTGLAGADRAQLTDRIARTMPPTGPETCVGDCAAAMADLIIDTLSEPADACNAVGATPRRLRLLTPREYARTVTDLFFVAPDATDCERHVFTLADVNAGAVHVAGSFNDWAPTVADGGWPMVRDGNRWRLETALPPGRHIYKFVLDAQTWIADPGNPLGEDDGFGGRNSVIDIAACPEDGPPPGLVAGLPAPTRPEGFFFDTHADSGRVTAVHFEGYLAAAERVAAAAFTNPDAWLACDPLAQGCADRFTTIVGRRVFRRPLTPAEQARYASLFTERSAQVALTAMLMSPHFLYRSERGQPSNDGHFRLTRYELATALAYLFWGTTPDDALLDAPLDTPEQIATIARSMLADPRARSMVGEFAVQWLGVGAIGTVSKSPELEPQFGRPVRAALLEETRAFVASAVAEGGRYADLVTAHSDPPAALAALYGDADRTGVQGLGSVLATYAHSDQTSPIRRGLFVRTHLLCQPLPPPPANAGGVPDVDPNATTRERFAQHTADDFCASCHQHIDPVGFGFERYDPIGRWRDTENGQPVDAAGDMTNVEGLGTQTSAPFDRLDSLGEILAGSDAAPACFAIQLQRFALGRAEGPADRCAVRALTEQFAATGGNLQQLWVDLVSAPAFYTRVEGQ